MLLNKFNASDQREVITMVNQFLEDFDYYDFPDEFVSPGSSEEKTSPARQMMPVAFDCVVLGTLL